VAFGGSTSGSPTAIYINRGSGIEVVADENTLIPDQGDTFTGVGDPSVDGSNVAFQGGGPGIQGVYVELGGVLMKVIEKGDTLDGKLVTGASIGSEGFKDGILGIQVGFTDNSAGVFTTDTNAP
jgi:hypothetical protein